MHGGGEDRGAFGRISNGRRDWYKAAAKGRKTGMAIIAQIRAPLASLTKSARDVIDAGRSILSWQRFKTLPKPGLPTLKSFGGPPTGEEDSVGRAVLASFVLLVLAPTFFYFLYAALWESDGYVSESRVTVQASEKPNQKSTMLSGAASIISRVTGGSATNTQQDSYIVLNYIKSSAIIVDLGGRPYLESVFSKGGIDFFSRLSRNEPIEELLKYWRSQVSASVDTISGILTFKVTAYDPGDALRVAQDIDRLSEDLINRISLRSRRDGLDRANDEVKRAGASLADARQKLLSFRNSNDLIDPGSRATSLGELIGKLTLEKIDAATSLNALSGTLSNDSPTERVLRAKLASLDQQINDLKATLADPKGVGVVASQIADYERLKLNEQFAEKIYLIAQDSYERARQELDKQQLYLVTIVPPVMPEKATYPKIIASTLLLFVSLLIFWSIGALIWASIRDQMD